METLTAAFLTFDTALGRCAIRWSGAGITGVRLPDPAARRLPGLESAGQVPPFVRRAVEGIAALLADGTGDLADLPLDETGIDPFRRAVYAATRAIPPGTTRTYGQIARAVGRPDAAREVGAALARNPFPIVVPCHRVVAADGALTGFSAPGGIATKRRMLAIEGAPGFGQLGLFPRFDAS
jgi:methylated-DNA-[protein]-cysteine S-methyltransferase